MKYLYLIFLLSIPHFSYSRTDSISVTIVSCNDGDTCRYKSMSNTLKVRLEGIDAPETGQKGSEGAKTFLNNLVKGKKVNLSCSGISYDRKNCIIFLNGKDINAEVVKNGWAWDVPNYSKGKYSKFEKEARNQKIGIWKNAPTESPYCFRKKTKNGKKCKKNKLTTG